MIVSAAAGIHIEVVDNDCPRYTSTDVVVRQILRSVVIFEKVHLNPHPPTFNNEVIAYPLRVCEFIFSRTPGEFDIA
jgi:hypothetical protein